MTRIHAIFFAASDGTYGSPRIHAALSQASVHVGYKRVAQLMQAAGLKARCTRLYRRMPTTRRFLLADMTFFIKSAQSLIASYGV